MSKILYNDGKWDGIWDLPKYQEMRETANTQLLNGTITTIDFIKQQNDETQSVMAKEVHSIQLLKAKYELMALKGQL